MQIAALLVLLISMLTPVGVVFLYLRKIQRADRRNPLTDDLLRLPAESLTEQQRDLALDLLSIMTLSLAVPAIALLSLMSFWIDPNKVTFGVIPLLAVVAIVGTMGWAMKKTWALIQSLHKVRAGIEGELATAQLLTPLLAEGWQLFHDIPGKRGNIDHVLVGPGGVYTIETKFRSKPSSIKGKEGATARYDGEAIHFPTGKDALAIQQAAAVSHELARQLSGRLGKSIPVTPVVSLPGWLVSSSVRPTRDQVLVINPKFHGLFKRSQALDSILQKQVCHALAELSVRTAKRA